MRPIMRMISVTQCLSILTSYGCVSASIMEAAANRGSLIHAHFLGMLKGMYLPCPIEISDEISALTEWKDRMIAEVIDVEAEVMDMSLGIVGHLDLACRLIHHSSGINSIIDLKCTALKPGPVVGLQTAGYKHLAEKTLKMKFKHRYGLHLNKDNKIELIEFKSEKDWPMFLAAYSLTNYLKGG